MKAGRAAAAMMAAGISLLPLPVRAMEAAEVVRIAEEAGQEYGICPEFLQAVAWYESGWQADASTGSCEGLMQVSPYWHSGRMARLGVQDLHDPEGNMLVAADYLAELFGEWEDPAVVLMVYNGDSGAQHYRETGEGLSGYARKVLELSEQLEREHGK